MVSSSLLDINIIIMPHNIKRIMCLWYVGMLWYVVDCSAAVLERGHLNFVSYFSLLCTASDHHKLVARENCN